MALKIEHRLGVLASPEQIWESLGDLSTWAQWNPLYTRAEGQIRIGETLTLDVVIPGQEMQTIHPKVVDWAPADHIHWKLTMLGGLVQSIRYLEIEHIDGAPGSIVSNGELFRGLLGPTLVKPRRRAIRDGFEALNQALKTRVEAQYAAQGELKF